MAHQVRTSRSRLSRSRRSWGQSHATGLDSQRGDDHARLEQRQPTDKTGSHSHARGRCARIDAQPTEAVAGAVARPAEATDLRVGTMERPDGDGRRGRAAWFRPAHTTRLAGIALHDGTQAVGTRTDGTFVDFRGCSIFKSSELRTQTNTSRCVTLGR